MKKITVFFREKSAGFYASLVGAVLLLVCAIVYSITFSASEHINLSFDSTVLILSLVGVVAFAALSAFKVTEKLAAPCLFLFGFIAFLVFMLGSYVYLSAVFFEISGISQFFEAIKVMEFGYAFTLVSMIVVWVLSTIGIFSGVNKKVKEEEANNNDEVSV